MEKRKWPWKKKSSEKSGGESESSESISSHSEKFSEDQQEAIRASASEDTQSPEVTSEAKKIDIDEDDEVKESVKILTEKLSAALVNVGAKEEFVKQHSKVAGKAVAGNY